MARPQSITDEEVLAAARVVFLEKGITATVEEVATRCGVGEATVFRRFPTKQALFIAAMETDSEPGWARTLAENWPTATRAGELDIRETLTALANEIVASGRKMLPLLLMKMSNPGMWLKQEKPPARVVRAIKLLTDFFTRESDAGRLRVRDPAIAARIWMGALQHFIMFEAFMKPIDNVPLDVFLEELVEMFCAAPVRPRKTRGS